jgi:hypothetical protein
MLRPKFTPVTLAAFCGLVLQFQANANAQSSAKAPNAHTVTLLPG